MSGNAFNPGPFNYALHFGLGTTARDAARSGFMALICYYGVTETNAGQILAALHAFRHDAERGTWRPGDNIYEHLQGLDLNIDSLIDGIHHIFNRFGDTQATRLAILEGIRDVEAGLMARFPNLPPYKWMYEGSDEDEDEDEGGSTSGPKQFPPGSTFGKLSIDDKPESGGVATGHLIDTANTHAPSCRKAGRKLRN